MSILFYCKFQNSAEWKRKVKQRFRNKKIISINETNKFNQVDIAIVWNLPDQILKKIT